MTDISSPTFEVYGYINGFSRQDFDGVIKWYARLSLIVDKDISGAGSFIFQSASLPFVGTAFKLIDAHTSSEGADRGWCKDENDKSILYLFRVKGYRAQAQDNDKYPFKMMGRVVSIEDTRD